MARRPKPREVVMPDLSRMDAVTSETHTNVQDVDQTARQSAYSPSVTTTILQLP